MDSIIELTKNKEIYEMFSNKGGYDIAKLYGFTAKDIVLCTDHICTWPDEKKRIAVFTLPETITSHSVCGMHARADIYTNGSIDFPVFFLTNNKQPYRLIGSFWGYIN